MIGESRRKTWRGRHLGFLFEGWWMGPPLAEMKISEENKLLRGNIEFKL